MTFDPIEQLLPTMTLLSKIELCPIEQFFPIFTFFPIVAPSDIDVKAPIYTLSPIDVLVHISALSESRPYYKAFPAHCPDATG